MRWIPTRSRSSVIPGLTRCALIFWTLAAAPPPALAASLLFTVGADGYALGVSEADAWASGLPIIHSPLEVQGENLSVSAETVPGSVFPGAPGGATQNFHVTYNADAVGPDPTHPEDRLLIVFKSFDTGVVDAPFGPYPWDYLGSFSGPSETPGTLTTVGFTLSPDWFLVSFFDDVLDQTLYFPAVTLGALAKGDFTTVPIGFWLTEPQIVPTADGGGLQVVLPHLLFDAAFVPIPEPATALLLALGLGGLTWCGSGRSCRRS